MTCKAIYKGPGTQYASIIVINDVNNDEDDSDDDDKSMFSMQYLEELLVC